MFFKISLEKKSKFKSKRMIKIRRSQPDFYSLGSNINKKFKINGRGEWIRTTGPQFPKLVR
jgi:hypothetical protein